jgi:hypothetical protein
MVHSAQDLRRPDFLCAGSIISAKGAPMAKGLVGETPQQLAHVDKTPQLGLQADVNF